ncbi:unnamed protein product [Calypogeia fissa]
MSTTGGPSLSKDSLAEGQVPPLTRSPSSDPVSWALQFRITASPSAIEDTPPLMADPPLPQGSSPRPPTRNSSRGVENNFLSSAESERPVDLAASISSAASMTSSPGMVSRPPQRASGAGQDDGDWDTWPSIRSSSGNSAAQQALVSAPTRAVSYQAGQTVGPSQVRKDASAVQPGIDNFLRGEGAPKSTPSTFTSASLVDAFGGDPFAAKAVVPVPPKPTPASSQGFGDFGDGGFRAEPSTLALVPTTAPTGF